MRYGSVCSGIEAATVAWHPLGFTPAWFSEIEPFPSAVLAKHWPAVPNLGDMTLIAERVRAGDVEAPDILVGGTPCQAFSVAGLRKGLADARGQLTLSFVDLANAIDEKRPDAPAIIVWENVPGVINSKDNAFGCFLAGLAGESDALRPPGGKWTHAGCVSGPERVVAWRMLDAQFFGLAQRRNRVFVVASARDDFDPREVLFEPDGVRRDTPPRREPGETITGTLAARTKGGGGLGTDFDCAGGLQPYTIAVRGRDTGSSVEIRNDGTANALLTPNGGRAGVGVGAIGWGPYVRRLMPIECERLQGFPDNHTLIPWNGKEAEQCPDGHRYRAIGNSMAVNVMRWLGLRILMGLLIF